SNDLDHVTPPDASSSPDGGTQENTLTSPDGGTLGDGASASKYRSLIMSDTPIGYWRMNITSGSIIADETNHRNSLVLQGSGVERGAKGAIAGDSDTSLRITDRSTYAQAQNARPFDFPNGAPFTIEFWARFDPLDGGDLGLGLLNAKSETGYSTFVHWPDRWG